MSAPLLTKSAAAAGIAGASGLSGFGIYKVAFREDTIKDTILNSYPLKFHGFLNSNDPKWSGVKTEYEKSESVDKPKGESGQVIEKDSLPSWCENEVNSPFKDKEDSKYKSVLRWCYLNTNTFEQQVGGKELAGPKTGAADGDGQAWKTAWTSYKPHITDLNWKITGSSNDTDLNGNDDAKGATALRTWCSSKTGIFMYANEAKTSFPKFEKFCLKA
ncbi:hypothetical protein MHF_0709 [Mycoplasma haemofelis Ohio2]|uniref:Uncharacterized protein n=1 Tax=Mycoplasma haemofelis (strain Ohio2) TaxID=859194 RepID=F6FID1_MYCHI|nr:hypothetical protein MHF_0709 [Mycoplasma haemofelis Ohio2]